MREAEGAWADLAREPAAFPWIGAQLSKADAIRRLAEKKLFQGEPDNWVYANAGLFDARKKLLGLRRQIEGFIRDRAVGREAE